LSPETAARSDPSGIYRNTSARLKLLNLENNPPGSKLAGHNLLTGLVDFAAASWNASETEVCHLSVKETRNRSQCSADTSVEHRPIWVCFMFTNGTYNGTSSDLHHLYCPGICRLQLPHHKKSQVRSERLSEEFKTGM
jgi:hypothetical protein